MRFRSGLRRWQNSPRGSALSHPFLPFTRRETLRLARKRGRLLVLAPGDDLPNSEASVGAPIAPTIAPLPCKIAPRFVPRFRCSCRKIQRQAIVLEPSFLAELEGFFADAAGTGNRDRWPFTPWRSQVRILCCPLFQPVGFRASFVATSEICAGCGFFDASGRFPMPALEMVVSARRIRRWFFSPAFTHLTKSSLRHPGSVQFLAPLN